MAYSSGFSNPFGFVVTPWVKRLLIANAVVFLITAAFTVLIPFLAFTPSRIIPQFWTPVTYMFVHLGLFHLLINMLLLFFFGPPLEQRWGSDEFLKFYFITGLGAAALSFIFPTQSIAGASGAVYGIMVAFALYWPDNPIYIWGIFPVKAKYLVGFLVGLSVFYTISGAQTGVAHLAHLGGAIAAFAYLKSSWSPSAWGPTPRTRRPRKWRVFTSSSEAKETAPKTPIRSTTARNREMHQALDEVDRILDKISEGGITSLTADERRQLEEASKRFRSS